MALSPFLFSTSSSSPLAAALKSKKVLVLVEGVFIAQVKFSPRVAGRLSADSSFGKFGNVKLMYEAKSDDIRSFERGKLAVVFSHWKNNLRPLIRKDHIIVGVMVNPNGMIHIMDESIYFSQYFTGAVLSVRLSGKRRIIQIEEDRKGNLVLDKLSDKVVLEMVDLEGNAVSYSQEYEELTGLIWTEAGTQTSSISAEKFMVNLIQDTAYDAIYRLLSAALVFMKSYEYLKLGLQADVKYVLTALDSLSLELEDRNSRSLFRCISNMTGSANLGAYEKVLERDFINSSLGDIAADFDRCRSFNYKLWKKNVGYVLCPWRSGSTKFFFIARLVEEVKQEIFYFFDIRDLALSHFGTILIEVRTDLHFRLRLADAAEDRRRALADSFEDSRSVEA